MKHINPGEQFRIPMDAVEDDVEKSGNKRLKTIWEKIQQEQDVDAMEYMSLACRKTLGWHADITVCRHRTAMTS